MPERVRRCAIYTRKSSEEGLEQDFNSLHAQREACEAYVASQRHEGWTLIAGAYDDGGFSGGSMERPGLKRLLADVAAGRIDVVVVYKVDRLTRALSDFARIVEIFDGKAVSFVSVTQAFNTTTSMGRLTLNVLLSFAQFEREVTGERIRDKIAASKKKGLWMGGLVPLGYRASGRTLAIEPAEAETVRTIYDLYVDLRSVDRLKEAVDRRGLRSKLRIDRNGGTSGGGLFARGHLYRILENPLYAGRIAHKREIFSGQHDAIIAPEIWDKVQALLGANSHARRIGTRSKNPSLLAGLIHDETGERLVATHAVKQGRRYRYYRSRGAGMGGGSAAAGEGGSWRLPADQLEAVVLQTLCGALRDEEWLLDTVAGEGNSIGEREALIRRGRDLAIRLKGDDTGDRRGILLDLVRRIDLGIDRIALSLSPAAIRGDNGDATRPRSGRGTNDDSLTIGKTMTIRRRGPELRLVVEGDGPAVPEPDPALVNALAQAHRWWRDLLDGRYATIRDLAGAYGKHERYVAWVIRLAFLSPALVRAVLDGKQPPEFTLHRILRTENLPVTWTEQAEW